MAYWEYVKLAGYTNHAINNSVSCYVTQLKRIEMGIADLPFSNAANYQTSQPRDTLLKNIEGQMRKDPNILPFL
jgi:hypothetical protein